MDDHRKREITDTPRATFILAYYKNPQNITKIINRIRLCGEDVEIIVHNDGKTEVDEINKLLHKPNEYQICSNNLNELRMYNNGIQMSNSDIVIISQDDDIPPDNPQWFEEAMSEMQKDLRLGVLSLYKGSENPSWTSKGKNIGPPPYRNPGPRIKYVAWSAFGPWFIRKETFNRCGGFSVKYSGVGEHGCGGVDSAFCAETWTNNYKVALLNTRASTQWKRHAGVRNSLRNKNVAKERNSRIAKNVGIYKEDYSEFYKEIESKIKKASARNDNG